MNTHILLSYLDVWFRSHPKERERKEIELNRIQYHYFGIKYIISKMVGGLIYLSWLLESVLKRVISSYVLILCLFDGAFVVYVYICISKEGMCTQGDYSPKRCIVYRPFQ